MKNLLVIFLLGINLIIALAQENEFKSVEEPEKVGEELNAMANKLNTIQADFIQEKHMDFLQMAIQSKGKFWFKKENQLRWEYNDPYNYVIIINDGKIHINDEGQNTEFKVKGNKIFQQVNDIIISSVKGDIMNDERFEAELLENADLFKVVLHPKQDEMAEIIKEMHMYFDKNPVSVSKIKMVEANNDYTIIKFKNKMINETIPSSVFNTP